MSKDPKPSAFKDYVKTYLGSHLDPQQSRQGSDYAQSINSFVISIAQVLRPKLDKQADVKFEIGFLGTPGLNAYADVHDGSYIMAMHSDVYRTIHAFAHACFSGERFFSHIGEPRYMNSKKVDHIWSFPITGEPVTFIQHPCPVRQAAANALAQLMTRIIWLHEFGHCHNRHIQILRERQISQRFSESPAALGAVGFPTRESFEANDEFFQLLEADADQWATEVSLWLQFNTLEPIDPIRSLEPRIRVGLIFFAIISATWVLENFGKGRHNSKHPTPDLRRSMMIHQLAGFTRDQRPDAKVLLVETYKEAGRAAETISNFIDLRQLLNIACSDETRQAISTLRKQTEKLRSVDD